MAECEEAEVSSEEEEEEEGELRRCGRTAVAEAWQSSELLIEAMPVGAVKNVGEGSYS